MERLTTKGYKYNSLDFMDDGMHHFANKLSRYEDTGLEPEDVNIAKKLAIKYLKDGVEYNEEAMCAARNLGIDTSSIMEANEVLMETIIRLDPAAGRGKR